MARAQRLGWERVNPAAATVSPLLCWWYPSYEWWIFSVLPSFLSQIQTSPSISNQHWEWLLRSVCLPQTVSLQTSCSCYNNGMKQGPFSGILPEIILSETRQGQRSPAWLFIWCLFAPPRELWGWWGQEPRLSIPVIWVMTGCVLRKQRWRKNKPFSCGLSGTHIQLCRTSQTYLVPTTFLPSHVCPMTHLCLTNLTRIQLQENHVRYPHPSETMLAHQDPDSQMPQADWLWFHPHGHKRDPLLNCEPFVSFSREVSDHCYLGSSLFLQTRPPGVHFFPSPSSPRILISAKVEAIVSIAQPVSPIPGLHDSKTINLLKKWNLGYSHLCIYSIR